MFVPRGFGETSTVYGSDTIVHAVYTNIVGAKSDDLAEPVMAGEESAVLDSSIPHPEDPGRTERRRGMGVGDLGKGGEKYRVKKILVCEK